MSSFTLMIQGTTSDAGKTVLVAGLCRALTRRGVRVAPFKPQNMALNSAVTSDGGEIGRAQAVQAQAVQAQACMIEPSTDMNPVLLKPNSDIGAQVIIQGKALTEMDATDFHDYKTVAMSAVLESYRRLSECYEAVIVEGAGSSAEINLRDKDIANMGFAEAVDCPVILVADIDRGGVFAHLVGTLELLSESEQQRVIGFVINKFRGDIALLYPGLEWLQRRTGKPVIGVLPYLQGFHLEAEDAISCQQVLDPSKDNLRVVVPVLPRISNHTDFDPLRLHPQVDLIFVGPGQKIPAADLIILPGSKSVICDLQWLRENDWEQVIQKHLRYGGKLMGICGGFQMLGNRINDPMQIEGKIKEAKALGLLDMSTSLKPEKQLRRTSGSLRLDGNTPINGYEIHAGVSSGPALLRPAIQLSDQSDGAISEDNQIFGTYLHGLFNNHEACESLLKWAGLTSMDTPDYEARREQDINRLADELEQHLNLAKLFEAVDPDNTALRFSAHQTAFPSDDTVPH